MNAQTPMETECIKFGNDYRINKYKNVWLEKESWYFKFGRPNGERCHWSLFLRDHIAAFHSLSIKFLILLCSAVRSLNKSPNAFYFVNTKMSCGVMTLTVSKCLGCHFFLFSVLNRGLAIRKLRYRGYEKFLCFVCYPHSEMASILLER